MLNFMQNYKYFFLVDVVDNANNSGSDDVEFALIQHRSHLTADNPATQADNVTGT